MLQKYLLKLACWPGSCSSSWPEAPVILVHTITVSWWANSPSGPLAAWLNKLFSLRQLQLVAVSIYSGDMLPPTCFECESDRQPILTYSTFNVIIWIVILNCLLQIYTVHLYASTVCWIYNIFNVCLICNQPAIAACWRQISLKNILHCGKDQMSNLCK